jgi:hypothetical protein
MKFGLISRVYDKLPLVILCLITMLLSGCSLLKKNKVDTASYKLKDYNVAFSSQVATDISINKNKLIEAIAITEGKPEIRTVELLYRSGESKPYPEYRIFGVEAESVYDLLGLQDADVIVAADGYILSQGAKFAAFVKLLPSLSEATIHFRRGRKPYVYKYKITD